MVSPFSLPIQTYTCILRYTRISKAQDCDHHADERREASAATTAHLTSSLKPSCPVYVRDLDYGERERELGIESIKVTVTVLPRLSPT